MHRGLWDSILRCLLVCSCICPIRNSCQHSYWGNVSSDIAPECPSKKTLTWLEHCLFVLWCVVFFQFCFSLFVCCFFFLNTFDANLIDCTQNFFFRNNIHICIILKSIRNKCVFVCVCVFCVFFNLFIYLFFFFL